MNPLTDVDRDEVTPPENVAVTLSGTLIMTIPEPPEYPTLAVSTPPPPPPPVLTVPAVPLLPLLNAELPPPPVPPRACVVDAGSAPPPPPPARVTDEPVIEDATPLPPAPP